jgi:hypothetical protein
LQEWGVGQEGPKLDKEKLFVLINHWT